MNGLHSAVVSMAFMRVAWAAESGAAGERPTLQEWLGWKRHARPEAAHV